MLSEAESLCLNASCVVVFQKSLKGVRFIVLIVVIHHSYLLIEFAVSTKVDDNSAGLNW